MPLLFYWCLFPCDGVYDAVAQSHKRPTESNTYCLVSYVRIVFSGHISHFNEFLCVHCFEHNKFQIDDNDDCCETSTAKTKLSVMHASTSVVIHSHKIAHVYTMHVRMYYVCICILERPTSNVACGYSYSCTFKYIILEAIFEVIHL